MQIRFADGRPAGDYAMVVPVAGKDRSSLALVGDNRPAVEAALDRQRFEGEAAQIQDLYLGGKKAEAMAVVPDKLVDEVALVGPKERIVDRLKAWKASPMKTMLIGTGSIEAIRTLANACA